MRASFAAARIASGVSRFEALSGRDFGNDLEAWKASRRTAERGSGLPGSAH